MKVWIVYEEIEGMQESKAGRHIHGVFDSEEKAVKFREALKKENPQNECIDLEAYEVE